MRGYIYSFYDLRRNAPLLPNIIEGIVEKVLFLIEHILITICFIESLCIYFNDMSLRHSEVLVENMNKIIESYENLNRLY